jgi:hypothetical protein
MAEKGRANAVPERRKGFAQVLGRAKKGFDQLCWRKTPLWILINGTTRRCEVKYGVIASHTESGWETDQMIVDQIRWLSAEIA